MRETSLHARACLRGNPHLRTALSGPLFGARSTGQIRSITFDTHFKCCRVSHPKWRCRRVVYRTAARRPSNRAAVLALIIQMTSCHKTRLQPSIHSHPSSSLPQAHLYPTGDPKMQARLYHIHWHCCLDWPTCKMAANQLHEKQSQRHL